jgi:DNA polymerase III gamma/tau subunit
MSLYHKYRPKDLSRIVGNEATVTALQTDLAKKDCPHAILIAGPTGCGKTTIARIIANELGCHGRDFKELNSADWRGIDTIREIRDQSAFKSLESNCRVWLIDECHSLTRDAQQAFLKLLEDSPKHVFYILATTDPQKLLDTVKGRCHIYTVKLLTEAEMTRLIRRIVKREDKIVPQSVIKQIVMDSLGHPRDAIQILDQIIDLDPNLMRKAAIRLATQQSQTIELCRALIKREHWSKISKILSGLKDQEPEKVRYAVLGYCQAVLLNSDNRMAAKIIEQFMEPTYATGFPGITFASYASIK